MRLDHANIETEKRKYITIYNRNMRKDSSSIGNNLFYTSHYAPESTALRFGEYQPKHRPLMKKSLNLDV